MPLCLDSTKLRRYSARRRQQRTLRAAGVALEQSSVRRSGWRGDTLPPSQQNGRARGTAQEAREECTHGRGRGEAGHAPEHGGERGGSRTRSRVWAPGARQGEAVASPSPPRSAGWQRLRRWTGQRDGEAWVPRAPVREGEKERQERQARGSALGGGETERERDRRGRDQMHAQRCGVVLVGRRLARSGGGCGCGCGCRISAVLPPERGVLAAAGSNQRAGLLPAGARWTRLALTDDWIGPGLDHHHYLTSTRKKTRQLSTAVSFDHLSLLKIFTLNYHIKSDDTYIKY